jgi:hypothetical protein
MAKSAHSEISQLEKDREAAALLDPAFPFVHETREILFPTEPTSIPREEIERAVERVVAARRKSQRLP